MNSMNVAALSLSGDAPLYEERVASTGAAVAAVPQHLLHGGAPALVRQVGRATLLTAHVQHHRVQRFADDLVAQPGVALLVDEDQDEDNDKYEQNGDGDGECQQRTLALLFPCTALSHAVLQWQQASGSSEHAQKYQCRPKANMQGVIVRVQVQV